jgi:hypothetical protein
MGELLELWTDSMRSSINQEMTDARVVLSVDIVAFRPLVEVNQNRKIEGLKNLDPVESLDLFSQFLINPDEFVCFFKDHWDDAYSVMFVFKLQPVCSDYPFSIVLL